MLLHGQTSLLASVFAMAALMAASQACGRRLRWQRSRNPRRRRAFRHFAASAYRDVPHGGQLPTPQSGAILVPWRNPRNGRPHTSNEYGTDQCVVHELCRKRGRAAPSGTSSRPNFTDVDRVRTAPQPPDQTEAPSTSNAVPAAAQIGTCRFSSRNTPTGIENVATVVTTSDNLLRTKNITVPRTLVPGIAAQSCRALPLGTSKAQFLSGTGPIGPDFGLERSLNHTLARVDLSSLATNGLP